MNALPDHDPGNLSNFQNASYNLTDNITDYLSPQEKKNLQEFVGASRKPLVNETFGFIQLTSTTCKRETCDHKEDREELCRNDESCVAKGGKSSLNFTLKQILHLALAEGQGKKKITDLLGNYFKEEDLNIEDTKCPLTGQIGEVGCQYFLYTLPQVLCVQLNRYQYDKDSKERRKISTQITIEEELDLTQYQYKKSQQSDSKNDNSRYRLSAYILHTGESTEKGHYTAVINIQEQWYEFSDKNISIKESPTKISKDDNKNIYLLFYTKNTQPSSSTSSSSLHPLGSSRSLSSKKPCQGCESEQSQLQNNTHHTCAKGDGSCTTGPPASASSSSSSLVSSIQDPPSLKIPSGVFEQMKKMEQTKQMESNIEKAKNKQKFFQSSSTQDPSAYYTYRSV